jgi:hypothetical protein
MEESAAVKERDQLAIYIARTNSNDVPLGVEGNKLYNACVVCDM